MFVVTNMCLSRQNPSFVATKICMIKLCLSRQNVCGNKYLSRQTRVSRDRSFVPTSILLSRHVFVVTNVCLSRQNFCRDKIMFVATHICHDKSFVETFIFIFIFCHDKHTFVATKSLSRQAYFCRHKRRVLSRPK